MDEQGQQVINSFSEAARNARTGDYSQAALSINSGVLRFQEFIVKEGKSARVKEYEGRLTYSLETLLLMLERKDWVAVADVIDYEFIPLWKETFSK
jgi:hypothetical protein